MLRYTGTVREAFRCVRDYGEQPGRVFGKGAILLAFGAANCEVERMEGDEG